MKTTPNILDLTFQAGCIFERFWLEKDIHKRQQMTVSYYTYEGLEKLKEESEMIKEILNHYGGFRHCFGYTYLCDADKFGRYCAIFNYTHKE